MPKISMKQEKKERQKAKNSLHGGDKHKAKKKYGNIVMKQ